MRNGYSDNPQGMGASRSLLELRSITFETNDYDLDIDERLLDLGQRDITQ